jgi:hypothetical protein
MAKTAWLVFIGWTPWSEAVLSDSYSDPPEELSEYEQKLHCGKDRW